MRNHNRSLILIIILVEVMLVSYATTTLVMVQGEEKEYGGTIKIAVEADPKSFNPLLHYFSHARLHHIFVFNRLITYDRDYNIIPDLAKNWEISDDYRTFTFYLYQNVTWHDGVKFTSADVKWHIEKSVEMPTIYGARLSDYDYIETPDDYTIRIHFETSKVFTSFLGLGIGDFITPKHIFEGTDVENNPHNWEDIVGTGPFKVKEYVRGSYTLLEAHEDYFRGRPYLDEVHILQIPTPEAAVMAIERGEIDVITHKPSITHTDAERLPTNPNIGVALTRSFFRWRIYFNCREEVGKDHPWLLNKKVRLAFAHAVDAQKCADVVTKGHSEIAWGPISPLHPFYNPNILPRPEYDPDLAETLLDEAGYPRGPDGWRFETRMVVYGINEGIELAEVVKEMLGEVGIKINLVIQDYSTWVGEILKGPKGQGDFPLNLGASGPTEDSDIRIDYVYPPPKGKTMNFYNNTRVAELADQFLTTVEPEERKNIIYEAQEIIMEDLPEVTIYSRCLPIVWRKEFAGFEERFNQGTNEWGFQNIANVWWTGASTSTPAPTFPFEVASIVVAIIALLVAIYAVILARKPSEK